MRDYFETQRFILRRFSDGDEEALYELLSDEDVTRFLPMFCLKDINEAKQYLKTYLNQKGRYAICFKENGVPIGYIHVSDDESHDFGYALKKEFWHQGIVSEVALKMIEELKASGIPYVTATHDIHNPNSGKVMKKIGMKYCYTYLEQWQPKDIPVHFRMNQYNFTAEQDFTYLKYWNMYPHYIEKDIV